MEPYFEGLDQFAYMTFDCETENCFYNQNGRCIYNIAPIKQRASRSCYEEEKQADMEAYLDSLE